MLEASCRIQEPVNKSTVLGPTTKSHVDSAERFVGAGKAASEARNVVNNEPFRRLYRKGYGSGEVCITDARLNTSKQRSTYAAYACGALEPRWDEGVAGKKNLLC